MKIITSSDTDRLTVTGMVVFDPWPFEDSAIFTKGIRYLANNSRCGGLVDGLVLSTWSEKALATLSDGTVAVCDPEHVTVGQEVRR